MNSKKFLYFLTAELILGVILVTAVSAFPKLFSAMAAFPFEQIGLGLRSLALTGKFGNGAAFVLWTFIGLLPLYPVLRHAGDKSRRAEHIMLVLLAVVQFVVLYAMINPGLLTRFAVFDVPELTGVMKALCGCTVWSLIVCVLVLRLVRMFRAGEKGQLFIYMKRILCVLCILFTGAMALEISRTIVVLTDAANGLGIFHAVLRCAAWVMPYVMDIAVTLAVSGLLDALTDENKAEAIVPCAQRLSSFACRALTLVTVCGAVYNIIELCLSRWLTDLQVQLDIPVVSLAFVLGILLVSRLVIENKKLSDDNDLFI
ncbi:MAG: hypothetical protein E7658_01980 [Ruminococcaceae bacterium]|nr:hypothetical protein [Oscillospiraceae bacterium]